MRNSNVAAKPVRSATTAIGEKPKIIACLPSTGASPKKKAEARAALIPVDCPFFIVVFIYLFDWQSVDCRVGCSA